MKDTLTLKRHYVQNLLQVIFIIATVIIKEKLKVLTVRRLDEESVLTQYLFQSISRSFLSSDDLK